VCAASVPFADRPTRPPLRAKGARVAINQVGPAVRPVGTQDAAARRKGKRRQGGGDFPAREQNTFLCDVARAATCERSERTHKNLFCFSSGCTVQQCEESSLRNCVTSRAGSGHAAGRRHLIGGTSGDVRGYGAGVTDAPHQA